MMMKCLLVLKSWELRLVSEASPRCQVLNAECQRLKMLAFNYLFEKKKKNCPKRLKALVRDIEAKQWQHWKQTQDFMAGLTFNQ